MDTIALTTIAGSMEMPGFKTEDDLIILVVIVVFNAITLV
jgi:hypothetical protein